MVGIQIILVVAFLYILYKFFDNPSSYQIRAWVKILTILFTIFAIGMIVFPNSANSLAHFFGVGRGADLLLYVLTISFIFTLLKNYIYAKKQQGLTTTLVRKIALMEAEKNNNGSK
jgi:hypothetical protein